MKHHTYFGRAILPCSYAENPSKGFRWYLETLPTSGIPYGEQDSPKFRSLAAVKAHLRETAALSR